MDLSASTSNIRNYMKTLLTRTDQINNLDCEYSQSSSDEVITIKSQHEATSVSPPLSEVDDRGSLDESLSTIDTTLSRFDDSQDLSAMCDIYQETINQVKSKLNEMHPEFENLEIDPRQFLTQWSDQNDQSSHPNESKNGEFEFYEQQIRPKTRRTWWVEEYDTDQGY